MQVIIPLLIWGYVLSLLIEPYLPLSLVKAYPSISVYLSYSSIGLLLFYFYIVRPFRQGLKEADTINFGPYKGEKWEDIPDYYLERVTEIRDDSNAKNALIELRKRRKIKKKQSNNRIGTIYDQDGNVSTECPIKESNQRL